MASADANNLLLSFYGDDFTGSTDAMEALTLAGVRTMLFIDPPDAAQLARYPGLGAVGVAGLSRSMTPDAMEAELRPAFAKLKALGAPIVHYKVCSTFDSSPRVGSIGRAIDVGREVFAEAPFVPLLVAAPALGRYCVFGNLFATLGRDGEPLRLDRHPSMSRHPVTPADESDLRVHLSRQTDKRIALFDVLKLNLPAPEARAALESILGGGPVGQTFLSASDVGTPTSDVGPTRTLSRGRQECLPHRRSPDVVLFDMLYEQQLESAGRLIDGYASRERPLFAVGSSGIEMALGAHWRAKGVVSPPRECSNPGPARPLLVASGSCSPVTARQIERVLSHGFAEVVLGRGEAALPKAKDATVDHLCAGRHVVVHTGRVIDEQVSPRLTGESLAAVVRAGVMQGGVKRVLIAGGDTAGYLARALGVEALEMVARLTPGAPLCRARAKAPPIDGLELNFKGGQVGGPDYFDAVANGRAE